MKVCVFGTRGFPDVEGGVEKHCEQLYTLLAENVELIVFRRKPYVKEKEKFDNIAFIDLPSTRIRGFEALLHSFLATLYTIWIKPDIVHIHNIGPALFAPLLKLFSIQVVLTYHSPNYEHKKWGRLAKSILRFSEFVALKYADRIIFVNRFQMEKYPDAIQEKSEYIPNGIQVRARSESQKCIAEFGLQGKRYILSVGRITPEKGFHTLIKAFRESGSKDSVLVIAGGVEFENGYMKELRKLASGLPVVFTGYVQGETLRQLYSHAQLFVLASENEGFPLVLLEAMSYQRNVLVSDIPATRLIDLPKADYFPVGDIAGLSEKIEKKMNESAARKYDLTEFTWDQCGRRVSNIYRELYKKGEIGV